MSPRKPVLGLILTLLAALPASATAATTIGELPLTGATYAAAACPAATGGAAWRLPLAPGYPGPPFEVPAGGGVITGFATRNIAAAGTPITFHVVTARGEPGLSKFYVKSLATVPATSAAADGITSVPARVPVAGGELLGIGRPAGTGDVNCVYLSGGTDAFGFLTSGEPPAGTEVESMASGNGRPNVRATLEPDADKDGFGDETQDGCPTIATLQGPCHTDLQTTVTAAEPRVPVGGVGVLAYTVRNAGKATAPGVRLTGTLPAGLTLVATTSAGGCAAGGLDCGVGDVPAGASALVLVVVRATTAGTKTLVGTAAAGIAEATPADNAAAGTIVAGPQSLQAQLCRVPKLRNLSSAAARKALVAAGCRLGRAGRPKSRARGRKLRVRAQSIPARTQVVAGTKVDVVLRYAARR